MTRYLYCQSYINQPKSNVCQERLALSNWQYTILYICKKKLNIYINSPKLITAAKKLRELFFFFSIYIFVLIYFVSKYLPHIIHIGFFASCLGAKTNFLAHSHISHFLYRISIILSWLGFVWSNDRKTGGKKCKCLLVISNLYHTFWAK